VPPVARLKELGSWHVKFPPSGLMIFSSAAVAKVLVDPGALLGGARTESELLGNNGSLGSRSCPAARNKRASGRGKLLSRNDLRAEDWKRRSASELRQLHGDYLPSQRAALRSSGRSKALLAPEMICARIERRDKLLISRVSEGAWRQDHIASDSEKLFRRSHSTSPLATAMIIEEHEISVDRLPAGAWHGV